MKTILLILFLGIATTARGQAFGLIGGYTLNKYYTWESDENRRLSNFDKGSGNFVELSIADFNFLKLPARASIRLENYRGIINTGFPNGTNAQNAVLAKVNNTTVSIGFQPIYFRIFDKLFISFGTEIGFRIIDRIQGYQVRWEWLELRNDFTTTVTIFPDESVRIHRNVYWGATGTIYYRIKIKKGTYLTPQYNYYYGLAPEFRNVGFNIKSMRHNIGIGINSTIK